MHVQHVPFRKSRLLLAAALTAGLAFTAAPVHAADAAPTDLVVNGTFSDGIDGWEAGAGQTLRVREGSKSAYATLWSAGGGSLSVTDKVDTVASLEAGATYRLSADVRTQLGSLTGSLRAREVAAAGSTSHTQAFSLAKGKWTSVSTDFVASRGGAALDITLLASGAAPYQPLQVDNVSLQKVDSTVAVPPTPTPTPTKPAPTPVPPVAGACVEDPISTSTDFGVTLDIPSGMNINEAWKHAVSSYGTPEMVRIFHPGPPSGWNAAKVAGGADLAVSFKIQPREVLSGAYDAALRTWFNTAPRDVQVYWTYFHEPEDDISRGEFTASDYRAAWKRIAAIAEDVCAPNLHSTLILMDWTVDPRSKRSFDDYYPGSAYIDVLGWDPYNPWQNNTGYKDPAAIFDPVIAVSNRYGKPFAIAETGSLVMPGDDGRQRAAWIKKAADHLRASGAVYVAYFDTQTPKGNDFRLIDSHSRAAWRAVIAE